MSSKTGQSYRLLSEAEWEYAARAGSDTVYSFGDDPAALGDYDWYSSNAGRSTEPVGGKKPNAFGLYDMHGNVLEWTSDCYHDSYRGAPRDGSAWTMACLDDRGRVVRGGSWGDSPRYLRVADRNWDSIDYWYGQKGFRLARTLGP